MMNNRNALGKLSLSPIINLRLAIKGVKLHVEHIIVALEDEIYVYRLMI